MKAKLTYFDMTGLGEPVRLMLVVAKIPFEDVRLDKRKWDALKPSMYLLNYILNMKLVLLSFPRRKPY